VPHRLAVRDFAGLRVHRPRLAAAGWRVPLWPGSVVGTDDDQVLRAKIGYTALQAHLGELVIRLGESHDLDEDRAWRTVRAVVDQTYAPLYTDPAVRAAADRRPQGPGPDASRRHRRHLPTGEEPAACPRLNRSAYRRRWSGR
jgi:siderophore synthetase component